MDEVFQTVIKLIWRTVTNDNTNSELWICSVIVQNPYSRNRELILVSIVLYIVSSLEKIDENSKKQEWIWKRTKDKARF